MPAVKPARLQQPQPDAARRAPLASATRPRARAPAVRGSSLQQPLEPRVLGGVPAAAVEIRSLRRPASHRAPWVLRHLPRAAGRGRAPWSSRVPTARHRRPCRAASATTPRLESARRRCAPRRSRSRTVRAHAPPQLRRFGDRPRARQQGDEVGVGGPVAEGLGTAAREGPGDISANGMQPGVVAVEEGRVGRGGQQLGQDGGAQVIARP